MYILKRISDSYSTDSLPGVQHGQFNWVSTKHTNQNCTDCNNRYKKSMDYDKTIEQYLGYKPDVYQEKSGWDYDVVLTGTHVFRFPKNDEIHQKMLREAKILPIVRPYVSLPIPELTVIDDTYMVGPLIIGEELPNHLEVYSKENIALLINFMKQLHAIPTKIITESNDKNQNLHTKSDEDFLVTFKRSLCEQSDGFMNAQQQKNMLRYVDELFTSFESTQEVFVHTDIQGKNILYDSNTKLIESIIDFTDARIGSIELDFCYFYGIHPDLLRTMIEEYFGYRNKDFYDKTFFLARRSILFALNNKAYFKNNQAQVYNGLKKFKFL